MGKDVKGKVFNIQRYSIHDGNGIRTIVFLKGCPLRCEWCANPESQNYHEELMFSTTRCVECGSCVHTCPRSAIAFKEDHAIYDPQNCDLCGKCISACKQHCIKISGRDYGVDELVEEVLKDEMFFFASGGGVTVSGGEPFAQYDFLIEFLKAASMRGLHTGIETCGVVDSDKFREALKWLDQVYMDLKHVDDEKHIKWTGGSNRQILANWKILAETKPAVVTRVPVIPGFNDGDDDIDRIAAFAESIGVKELHLLPYHDLGKSKYAGLAREYPMGNTPKPDDLFMDHLKEIAEKHINKVLIGG